MKKINRHMLEAGFSIAENIKAHYILLHIDPLDEYQLPSKPKDSEIIIITKKQQEALKSIKDEYSRVIPLPELKLGRVGIIKVSVAYAVFMGFVESGEKIVFISGNVENQQLDRILVIEVGKDNEEISSQEIKEIASHVKPAIFERLLYLSLELAIKGREGKKIGTLFVLGDHDKVLSVSKQLIMNPFKGYEESDRNILNPDLTETIREFSALDGAFIVSEDGTLITAGIYLGAAIKETDLPKGLGSRHMAAAGITALTKAVAIVISESSGNIRIFREGKSILEIETPQT